MKEKKRDNERKEKKEKRKQKKALISYHLSQKTYFRRSGLYSVCFIVISPGMYENKGLGTMLSVSSRSHQNEEK
jgi:hypothetical protein